MWQHDGMNRLSFFIALISGMQSGVYEEFWLGAFAKEQYTWENNTVFENQNFLQMYDGDECVILQNATDIRYITGTGCTNPTLDIYALCEKGI